MARPELPRTGGSRAAGRDLVGAGGSRAAGRDLVGAGGSRAAGRDLVGAGGSRAAGRDLVGETTTLLSGSAALRARDACRPTESDIAEAEAGLVLVRRNWKPPTPPH